LAEWRNHFSQLLNVRRVNDVRQTEIYIVEPLVSEPNAFEHELAIEKLKSHILIKSKQNLLRLEFGQIAMGSINILFLFGIRKNCRKMGRSRSFYLPIRRATKEFVVIIGAYQFANYVQNFIQHSASILTPYAEETIEDHQ
jgi:hypothetical protein